MGHAGPGSYPSQNSACATILCTDTAGSGFIRGAIDGAKDHVHIAHMDMKRAIFAAGSFLLQVPTFNRTSNTGNKNATWHDTIFIRHKVRAVHRLNKIRNHEVNETHVAFRQRVVKCTRIHTRRLR